MAAQLWPGYIRRIDELAAGMDDEKWAVKPSSELAQDNRVTRPYQLSHAVQMCMNAGIDQLGGLRHMIFGAPDEDRARPVLHQSAHLVLARSAIENFATAIWMLQPADRSVRAERVLRWHVKNVKDRGSAMRNVEDAVERSAPASDDLGKLRQIMQRSGPVPAKFDNGYFSKHVLEYVDKTSDDQERSASSLFLWQLCSGFAHNRPWAQLSFLERELQPTRDPEVLNARLTSGLRHALMGPMRAVELHDRAQRLYDERNIPMFGRRSTRRRSR